MKVRLLVSVAFADAAYPAGEVIEVEKDHAVRMFEAGQAEPVASKPASRSEKRPAAAGASKGEKR